MGKIRCSKCGYLLGELDSRARGKALIECHICKKVNKYSNPSKGKARDIDITIRIKDADDWLPN